MAQQAPRWITVPILGLVTFVLTHQLVFLNTYGAATDAALVRTGHGTGWTLTEIAAAAMAIGLFVWAGSELLRLSRRARALEVTGLAWLDEPLRELAGPLLRWWLLLGILAAALFTFNENVEHAVIGAPLPGLGVFGGPEYEGTLPVLIAVAFCVAGLRALFSWRRAVLMARLRPQRPSLPRPGVPGAPRRSRRDDRRPPTYIGGGFANRAPPRLAGS